jgi:hypothetical protein
MPTLPHLGTSAFSRGPPRQARGSDASSMELPVAARRTVTKKLATRYQRATRAEKSVVLDELVGLTGWHRDDARAALREAGTLPPIDGPEGHRHPGGGGRSCGGRPAGASPRCWPPWCRSRAATVTSR